MVMLGDDSFLIWIVHKLFNLVENGLINNASGVVNQRGVVSNVMTEKTIPFQKLGLSSRRQGDHNKLCRSCLVIRVQITKRE